MKQQKPENEIVTSQGMLPPWVQMMREAAMSRIKPADIEAMVDKQIEKAKAGDEKALKFVFEQVLGGASMKGATFVQNNYQYGAGTTNTKPEEVGKLTHQQLEDRAIGLICGQCGYEPETPDRSKQCPKCNGSRWEHKAVSPATLG